MADGVGLGLKKEPPIEGALGLSHLASHQATLRFRVPHVTVPLVAALGRFARKSFDEGQYQATIRPFAPCFFRHKRREACLRRSEGPAQRQAPVALWVAPASGENSFAIGQLSFSSPSAFANRQIRSASEIRTVAAIRPRERLRLTD